MRQTIPFELEGNPAVAINRARRQLSGLLDATSVARGCQYALAGRARIVSEQRTGLEIEFESVCLGSRPAPYTQDVVLSFDESGTLDLVEGECSCPMQTDCKHVACAALVWLCSRPDAGTQVAAGNAPGATNAPEAVAIAPEAQDWLRRFEAALARSPEMPLKGECVCYTLSEEGRSLGILKARILKDGRLSAIGQSAPDLNWLFSGREPPRYLGSLDVPVFHAVARLRRASGIHSGWTLEGEAGREALDGALKTGRLSCAWEARTG